MTFRLQAEEGTLSIMKAAAALLLLITCSTPLVSACASSGVIDRSIDDATITTRVKTALLNDPVIDATKIDVDTSAGVVTLNGVVKSKEEEAKAIALTRGVSGVRQVKSSLQIQEAGGTPHLAPVTCSSQSVTSTPRSGFVPPVRPTRAEFRGPR